MTLIFVARYEKSPNESGIFQTEPSKWINSYAVDSNYGGDEINETNLEKAIQKSGAVSYDTFELSEIEYDGEELIWDQLYDEIKENKIRKLERQIEETKEKLAQNKEALKSPEVSEQVSSLAQFNIEYYSRELKHNEKMLQDIRNDEW